MVTIISTHPTTVRYAIWEEDSAMHMKRRVWDCTIAGGAGVAQGNGKLYTPSGVATEVSDEALEKLKQIPAFLEDIEEGYIKVLENTKARSVDANEEAEKDMNLHASGQQITAKELEADGAEVNEDGSVDVSKGGKNAVQKRDHETTHGKKTAAKFAKKGK